MLNRVKEFILDTLGIKKAIIIAVCIALAMLVLVIRGINKGKVDNQVDPTATVAPEDDFEAQQNYLADFCLFTRREGYRITEDCQELPIGNNSLTAEDVGYTFIRSLSHLDFETATKYSTKSQVIDRYNRYFDDVSDFSYSANFERQMYKQALLSLAAVGVSDTAALNTGKTAITFNVEMLDLTDKDFWKADAKELFTNLAQYQATESDSTKAKEYLYNYIIEYYSRPDAVKRTVPVQITVEAFDNGSYYLLVDDYALDAMLIYQDGAIVTDYIIAQFEEYLWNDDVQTQLQEDKNNAVPADVYQNDATNQAETTEQP